MSVLRYLYFKILIYSFMCFQDLPQQIQQPIPQIRPNYQMVRNPQQIPQNTNINNIPLPVINLLQGMQTKQQIIRNNTNMTAMRTNISSPMSPLSLNVSPMYSLPPSPNSYTHSPAMSPAQRERVMSPYSTPQSLSPVGKFQQYSPSRLMSPVGVMQGCDPYLSNKMQPSPVFLQTPEIMLEPTGPMSATDFWSEADLLQNTSDLLTALDDVKLV